MLAAISETDLIPVRALNQVSYCPRLYWLQYVEGLMVINEHVEDGLVKHSRVNDPKAAGRPRKERDAIHTRSVSLASERLGLTSTLDLIEEKGDEVYPVEYKRSAAPTDADGQATYWDNDAIQL
ncbi:MAG: CRISPR-associated protein Cas4, partial [Candidatus Entotheonellia bacterium]